jgi:hypothetical protein
MRLVLIVIFVAASLATAIAYACTTSCKTPSARGAARAASVAFVGTITKTNRTDQCRYPKHPTWCTSSYSYEVTVEGVWKGQVGKTITVDAGHNRGDCSIGSLGKDVTNQRWLFFSRHNPVKLRICGGSRRATDKDIAAITADLGAPAAP